MLLRAKEAAEDHGYHRATCMSMVCGFVTHRHRQGWPAVMAEITRRTDLPIAPEGIYRWVAFLPSRMDEACRSPTHFGVFDDGSFKVRGIGPAATTPRLSLPPPRCVCWSSWPR